MSASLGATVRAGSRNRYGLSLSLSFFSLSLSSLFSLSLSLSWFLSSLSLSLSLSLCRSLSLSLSFSPFLCSGGVCSASLGATVRAGSVNRYGLSLFPSVSRLFAVSFLPLAHFSSFLIMFALSVSSLSLSLSLSPSLSVSHALSLTHSLTFYVFEFCPGGALVHPTACPPKLIR